MLPAEYFSVHPSLDPSDDDTKNLSMMDSTSVNLDLALPDVPLFTPPLKLELAPEVLTTDHESDLLKLFEDAALPSSLKGQKLDTLFEDVSVDQPSSAMETFMTSLLGEEPDNSGLELSLTAPLFVDANHDTQMTFFPNFSDSVSTVIFPDTNDQTYRWRNDLGLLDRLSYKSRDEIPRNWKETTIDPIRIASSRQIELPETHLLENHPTLLNGDPTEGASFHPPTSQITRGDSIPGDETNGPPKKRTRINKKPPQGNNRYGRKGALKCLRCRRARRKCVYVSQDSPCDRCHQHGWNDCIKIPQRTQTNWLRLRNLRKEGEERARRDLASHVDSVPLQNAVPALVSTGNVLLPVQTNTPDLNSHTARTAATLALRAIQGSPSDCRDNLEFFFKLAALSLDRCLNVALDDPFGYQIVSNSIIASTLLAWVTYSSNISEFSTSSYFMMSYAQAVHAAAAVDTIDRFRSPPIPKNVRTECFLHASVALDCANAWLIRNGMYPPRTTTFAQRKLYFTHFEDLNSATWHPATLEAANTTLGNLFEVCLTAALQFAKNELNLNLSREGADNVLQYIRAELGDADLHRALKDLYRSHQGTNTNHTTVVGQLTTRLFHRLRCVLLLHEILSQDSIYTGAQTPDAINIATKIVCFCGKQVIRRGGPIEDYYLQSWHNFSYLMLGGMGLPDDSPPAVREWVVDELMFVGREECAIALRNYWENKGIAELVQILEFAQYPKPMDEEWQV